VKLSKLLSVFILALLALKSFAADSVLVVSMDGVHPVAIAGHTTPTLHALMQQPGRYSMRGRSVEPPRTLIAHTAMLTGMPTRHISKTDQEWFPGQPQVAWPTLFDDMKAADYRTAFFYAVPKLGFLINPAIGTHAYAPKDGIERARAFFKDTGKRFVFLQLPGMPWEIYENRQFTKEYLEQLARTDAALAPLFDDLRKRGDYVIVVTSAHSGPDYFRDYDHPEDYKVPLISFSNRNRTALLVQAVDADGYPGSVSHGVRNRTLALGDRDWLITELRDLVGKLIK